MKNKLIIILLILSFFSATNVLAAKVQSNPSVDCKNENAESCNQYTFTNQRKKHVSLEIGKTTNGYNYLYLSFDSFNTYLTRNNNGQIIVDEGGVGNDVYEVKDDSIWELDSNGKYGQLDVRFDTNYSTTYYIYKKADTSSGQGGSGESGGTTTPPAYGEGTIPNVVEKEPTTTDPKSPTTGDKVPDQSITPIGPLCEQQRIRSAFKILGYALFVLKIVVPLLLMGLAVWDFFRAMISSDDKANREAISKLIRRAIIAVIIFIIPSVLNYALLLVDGAIETTSKFTDCTTCLLNPKDCKN